MLAALPDDLSGMRDRPLLLVGFASEIRRSEFVLDLMAAMAEQAQHALEERAKPRPTRKEHAVRLVVGR
jgi:hypothetical protein